LLNIFSTEDGVHGAQKVLSMASEWQTAFVVSQNAMMCLANCRQELQQKSWKTDQDQDFMIQDQYFHVCPWGASRPRPWSGGLHHCFYFNCGTGIVTTSLLLKLNMLVWGKA